MAKKSVICAAPYNNSRNGLVCHSSTAPSPSSSSPCSSMGVVYTDIGSLSLSPSFGMTPPGSSSSHEMENRRLTWGFPFTGNYRANSAAAAEVKVSDCSDGSGENDEAINHNANSSHEENPNENMISGRETDSGQSKLCARGHWRPAEDTRLRELVALYGPQNWNLIAEKLEGRSGKIA